MYNLIIHIKNTYIVKTSLEIRQWKITWTSYFVKSTFSPLPDIEGIDRQVTSKNIFAGEATFLTSAVVGVQRFV